MKTSINVPKEKEKLVLANGAIYDDKSKSFYVPKDVVISIFNEFIPLTIELVPSSNWYNNVRSEMKASWDDIRRTSYKQAGYKCEICSGVGPKHPVECHETWEFDMVNHIQKLIGLTSLCPMCHKSKHIGLAFIKGEEKEVIKHIKKVNGWTNADANKYIEEAFKIHDILSRTEWTLDLSYVDVFMQETK